MDDLPHFDVEKKEEKKEEKKRKLRKQWHQLKTPESKRMLNSATRELKELFNSNKNENVKDFLQNLTPTETTDYSLWKTTKKLKHTIKTLPLCMAVLL